MKNMYVISETEYGNICISKNNSDGTFTIFTEDESNSDYQAYLAWLEENPEADPA